MGVPATLGQLLKCWFLEWIQKCLFWMELFVQITSTRRWIMRFFFEEKRHVWSGFILDQLLFCTQKFQQVADNKHKVYVFTLYRECSREIQEHTFRTIFCWRCQYFIFEKNIVWAVGFWGDVSFCEAVHERENDDAAEVTRWVVHIFCVNVFAESENTLLKNCIKRSYTWHPPVIDIIRAAFLEV